MKRRSAVAAFAAALGGLAGCAGRLPTDPAEGDAATVADSFEGGPDRPECEVESESIEVTVSNETREYETAATIPYPGSPASFDEGAVVEYVRGFEEAYVAGEALCDRSGSSHVVRIGYTVDRVEAFDRPGGGWTVFQRFAGGPSMGVSDGGLWQADIRYRNVMYAVDETGAARAEFDDPRDPTRREIESEAPDPIEEGDLVAVFDR